MSEREIRFEDYIVVEHIDKLFFDVGGRMELFLSLPSIKA